MLLLSSPSDKLLAEKLIKMETALSIKSSLCYHDVAVIPSTNEFEVVYEYSTSRIDELDEDGYELYGEEQLDLESDSEGSEINHYAKIGEVYNTGGFISGYEKSADGFSSDGSSSSRSSRSSRSSKSSISSLNSSNFSARRGQSS